jgi:hypothetical protein|tara:strand:+ start:97 stop:996 length:900 start_codon:yes stop_codon:yes gene_type:complete
MISTKPSKGEVLMIRTNKNNLPKVFERFSDNNEYSRGDADISVTSLIDSPQIFRLKKLHDDVIEEDVSDQIFAILGTAVHAVLEEGSGFDDIVEQRLYMDIDGARLSGAIDLQSPCPNCDDGLIVTDYKTTSAWTLKYSIEGKPEWNKQLNCYAELVEEAKGKKVCALEVIAICRDWKKKDTPLPNYPKTPVVRISIPLWDKDRRQEYIKGRLAAHASDGAACSPSERWAKPGKFAVNRTGRKSAVKLLDSQEEAEEFMSKLRGEGYSIAYRNEDNIRCENNYCQVSEFCTQFRSIKGI